MAMALSGSFYKYPVDNFGLYCTWSATQSVTGNYSDVTLNVYLKYYTLSVGSRSDSTVSINGVSETYTAPAISDTSADYDLTLLKTYTVRVYHNSNGTKTGVALSAYRREVWRCNSKFKGEARCETPALDTEVIQRMFLKAYNQLMGSREQVIQACEVMRSVVADFTELDAEIDALNEEIQVVAGLVSQCIKENATSQQSQGEYNKKYNRLVRRYGKAVDRLKRANAEKESRTDRDRDIRIFIAEIEKQPLVLETWDERLWISLLDSATVLANGKITFRFKNGTDIEIQA